MDIRVT